ncbi:MAG: branched-chain amino acid ABC transporter permease [Bacteroidota bacterium]
MLFFQLIANGLVAGCAFALIALGFGLVYNTTRIFHLAHGAVYVVAAYLFYSAFTLWGWPLLIAAVFTVSAATVLGVLIDEVLYQPLDRRGASPLIHLLSSLGLYIVVVNFIALVFGNQTKMLSPGIQRTVHLGEVILTEVQVATVLVFLLLFVCMAMSLRRSVWGRRLRAMRDDPELVAAVGINPVLVRRVVFGVGSMLAAIAAILLGLDVGIDPNIGLTAVLTATVAVIIGGIGIFEGAALGALLLGVLQSLAVWQLSSRWSEAVTFSVLLLFLLVRPEGLLGQRRRIEEAPA